ncbi:MAG TPA: GGDEF domain-containing protein [Gemmatimonadales bacterium]|nr:GGDEF domain-containing protein [Gemmatimonadales bacterium]
MSLAAVLLAALIGAGIGWAVARRQAGQGIAPEVGPHFLPDPALEWLRRAYDALGVWVAELDPREEGPRAERIVDAERLSVTQIVAVDRRLERARDQEQSGAERLDSGTLVFHATSGTAVAVLLPPEFDAARLSLVEADLRRLLEGVRRRPQIVALAQAQTQEASLESVGSVGLRLAYQLERVLDAQVIVASREAAAEPAPGDTLPSLAPVRIVGVSGRGDRRLLDTVVPEISDIARVARGEVGQLSMQGDPLGGVVPDRRQRPGTVLLMPILVGDEAFGAVAIWPPGGREPLGAALGELTEALANAGPRLARALEADKRAAHAVSDRLTGLANRRKFDELIAQAEPRGPRAGALVYTDLDRFKLLNDTLGHPAGDAALVHFAHIIQSQIRGGDLAARIGGEEFAVWLPKADLETGARIAERIRIRLGTTPWDWNGRTWPLSASFGVAACPETGATLKLLPAQADAALYVAKNSGRNRVERAGREAVLRTTGR